MWLFLNPMTKQQKIDAVSLKHLKWALLVTSQILSLLTLIENLYAPSICSNVHRQFA